MSKLDCGDFYIISNENNPVMGSNGKDIIISADGGWNEEFNGNFSAADTRFEIQFYVRENEMLQSRLRLAILDEVEPIDSFAGYIKDYSLCRYADDPAESDILTLLQNDYNPKPSPKHVLTIKPGVYTSLSNIVFRLANSNFTYNRILCYFCRYTSNRALTVNGRKATEGDLKRLGANTQSNQVIRTNQKITRGF